MGTDMNPVDEQLGGVTVSLGIKPKRDSKYVGSTPATSTSSRLAPAGRERLALMNETSRWGEVGRQKPVLEVE